MKGTAATAPFCGSEARSCCCSVADEQRLREAFLAEVQAHGYHDAECRSELKAYICAPKKMHNKRRHRSHRQAHQPLKDECADYEGEVSRYEGRWNEEIKEDKKEEQVPTTPAEEEETPTLSTPTKPV